MTPGARTAVRTYDEYGNPGPTNTGRYQYTGQTWLSDAGVYHYKNRAYHPGLMRFMQADPIGRTGGINLYAYVVNMVDPWGLEKEVPDGYVKTKDGCRPGEHARPMGDNWFVCESFANFIGRGWQGGGGPKFLFFRGSGGGVSDKPPKVDEGEGVLCKILGIALAADPGRNFWNAVGKMRGWDTHSLTVYGGAGVDATLFAGASGEIGIWSTLSGSSYGFYSVSPSGQAGVDAEIGLFSGYSLAPPNSGPNDFGFLSGSFGPVDATRTWGSIDGWRFGAPLGSPVGLTGNGLNHSHTPALNARVCK